jgi:hypothetical protein
VAGAGEHDDDHKTLPEAGLIDATEDTPGDTPARESDSGPGAARA